LTQTCSKSKENVIDRKLNALLMNVILNEYVTNFDVPDANFDHSVLFSDAQVEEVGNPKKNVKTVKEPSGENQNRVP
jgi:hypothetical protein